MKQYFALCKQNIALSDGGFLSEAETLGGRAKKVRDEMKLSQPKMAETLSISLRSWQMMERNEGVPSGDTLLRFETIGLNPGWILTGIGPKYIKESGGKTTDQEDAQRLIRQAVQEMKQVAFDASEMVQQAFDPPPPPTIKYLPLRASAGGGAVVLRETDGIDMNIDMLAENLLGIRRKHILLLEIKGDSMWPTLCDGDIVVVDTTEPRSDGPDENKIYVISIDGELFVKRARWPDWKILHWCSDNKDFAPIEVTGEEIDNLRPVGRVRWLWRPVK